MSTTARRLMIVATVLVVAAGLITVGIRALLRHIDLPVADFARCDVVGTEFQVTTEQAANAATVTAVGMRRKLPARAMEIALAVAMQESKLTNLSYGDLDSVGLFQQRSSQGWGTPSQIMDPRYASGKFYEQLVKVSDWSTRPLTEVAQQVQRSGHPGAYAKWEDQSVALAAALIGHKPAGLTCEFPAPTVAASPKRVLELLSLDLPVSRLSTAVNTGEIRPGATAWASVSWLVAHADQLGLKTVGYAGQRWSREDGWVADPGGAGDRIRFETVQAAA